MLLEYYYIGGETINRSYPIFDGLGGFQNDDKIALFDWLIGNQSDTTWNFFQTNIICQNFMPWPLQHSVSMIVNITVSVRMDRSIRVRGSLITVLTFSKIANNYGTRKWLILDNVCNFRLSIWIKRNPMLVKKKFKWARFPDFWLASEAVLWLAQRKINLKTYISVVASYNSSDWTYGWVSMLDGFSIFVNSEMGTGLFKLGDPRTTRICKN